MSRRRYSSYSRTYTVNFKVRVFCGRCRIVAHLRYLVLLGAFVLSSYLYVYAELFNNIILRYYGVT